MYMPDCMRNILNQYAKEVLQVYGKSLQSVILYGSYARGDFTEDSDVDIMILVDLPEEGIRDHREQLSAVTYDFNMEHDVQIMPIVKEKEQFQYWLPVYPFYQNVKKEGVNLYAT